MFFSLKTPNWGVSILHHNHVQYIARAVISVDWIWKQIQFGKWTKKQIDILLTLAKIPGGNKTVILSMHNNKYMYEQFVFSIKDDLSLSANVHARDLFLIVAKPNFKGNRTFCDQYAKFLRKNGNNATQSCQLNLAVIVLKIELLVLYWIHYNFLILITISIVILYRYLHIIHIMNPLDR